MKFSPDGSEIRVAAAMDHGVLTVSVEDRGRGLEAAALQRVFEPFYRLGGSRDGGSGLGLAVASGLVVAHGGRIWAEPREGGGTRFAFTIPAEDQTS
jgi:two-component system sensor histidine kinase VicK